MVTEDQASLVKQSQVVMEGSGQESEEGEYIRTVAYGRDWKTAKHTAVDRDPFIPDGTLNIRFEYVPAQVRRAAEPAGKIITWARFHALPARNDVDALESVGVLLSYRLFDRAEKTIRSFFEVTSAVTGRTVPPPGFDFLTESIKAEFRELEKKDAASQKKDAASQKEIR